MQLIHPFPSTLDAAATAILASLAGADPPTSARLAVAMLALQASIGALNDLRDAGVDATAKPSKPIPRGLASPSDARTVWLVGLTAGLLLSAPSGPLTIAIAIAGVGCGYAYDLWLKPTALSWLPLAVGLPLLPVFAIVGAGLSLPPGFLVLAPLAVAAGAGLAIANALADVERDRISGLSTVVGRLGDQAAWRLQATLQVAVTGVALGSLPALGGHGPGVVGTIVGAAIVIAGLALSRSGGPHRRERGWELEALGIATLGASWLAAVALSP